MTRSPAPHAAPTRLPGVARAACLAAVLTGYARVAPAQLISIRTVPVAQADQFDIFPSTTLGMGGVSIALPDTLLDPFLNPATGSRVAAARVFGSPGLYSISSDAGGGRTLPVAVLARAGAWFGGLALALQEVDASRPVTESPPVFIAPADVNASVVPQPLPVLGPPERTHGNRFGFATLGRHWRGIGLAVAGSAFWAGLNAVDGVDLLYAGSSRVRQDGDAVDLRLGLVKEWPGERSLEALVLHSRFGMTHDVTYLEWFWDPATQQPLPRTRVDQNLDRTNTWGVHLEYRRPLTATGWRIGWLVTANRQLHPKIPNYEIMSIPRDPGDSWAYNLGIGISRTRGSATIGLDAIYEPIRSTTWADAARPIETVRGDTIPVGGKTIENDFRFSNALLRMGVTQQVAMGTLGRAAAVQLGLVVRSIGYHLDQWDHVQQTGRGQVERWTEWSPTWGLSLRLPELEIRYRGRATHGTGRPGVARTGGFGRGVAEAAAVPTGILAAPSGPLTLDEVRVVSHQVSVSLPLR